MRKRIMLFAVFLLLGAIVNVAVAWGFAWKGTTGRQQIVTVGTFPYQWIVMAYFGTGRIRINSLIAIKEENPSAAELRAQLPYWSRAHDFPIEYDNRPKRENYSLEEATGWPLLSLRSAFDISSFVLKMELQQWKDPDTQYFDDHAVATLDDGTQFVLEYTRGNCVEWGILIEVPTPTLQGEVRMLPVKPIPAGFAINTIFYAAVLWMMFVFPFALRRRLRIRRGLCPACAYPVGSSPVCTECGGAIKRSEVSGQKSENVQT